MYKFFSVFLIIVTFFVNAVYVKAGQGGGGADRIDPFAAVKAAAAAAEAAAAAAAKTTSAFVNKGYTCTLSSFDGTNKISSCVKTFETGYHKAKKEQRANTLTGYPEISSDTQTAVDPSITSLIWTWRGGGGRGSNPFIYLRNTPTGALSVTISSLLDRYYPDPLFNQKNGWNLMSENGKLSMGSSSVQHLFYLLDLDKITINRNGKNFSSKKEMISYLKNSDFFTNLGLSEKEKKNSLGYIIPEILKAENTEYYYLSIMNDSSIEEVSVLAITPKPNRIDRRFIAIYPTNTTVKTSGDFIFPKNDKEDGFTVKETGEILIMPHMFVFFK